MTEPEKKENFLSPCAMVEYQENSEFEKGLFNPSPLVNKIILYNIYTKDKKINSKEQVKQIFELINANDFKALTLRFSFRFMEKASKRKICDFIRRRINANLKNSLGYIPKFLFVLEEETPINLGENTQSRQFHIHGIIEADDEKILPIKLVLKRTSFGKDFRQSNFNKNIVMLKDITDKRGWAEYITKDLNNDRRKLYISRELTQLAHKYLKQFSNLI